MRRKAPKKLKIKRERPEVALPGSGRVEDLQLLKFRFPDRKRDFGTVSFWGPFSREEMAWAGIKGTGWELGDPNSSTSEEWLISFSGANSQAEVLEAFEAFDCARRKELGLTEGQE